MSASKKYSHYENYLLKGKFRRNGFERWRYVFTGLNRTTGDQRTFFIELYYINPLISPDKPILAQKSRPKISESDLQYALAGTASAQSVSQEFSVQPSYVLVKAGVYGVGGRQFNKFFPAKILYSIKKKVHSKLIRLCLETMPLLVQLQFHLQKSRISRNFCVLPV